MKKIALLLTGLCFLCNCFFEKNSCTLVGCRNQITIEISNVDITNDSVVVTVNPDFAPEFQLFPGDSTKNDVPEPGGFIDVVELDGFIVNHFYNDLTGELTILIKPVDQHLDSFIQSKMLDLHYVNGLVEIDTTYYINYEINYPNGYECDKDSPCYQEIFELQLP